MYLFYSEDHFLLVQAVDRLIVQLKQNANYQVEKYSLIHHPLQEIYNSLTTYSLFDEHKIIVIEDAWCFSDEKIQLHKTYDVQIIDKIMHHTTDNMVIFVLNHHTIAKNLKCVKTITQLGQLQQIKPVTPVQLKAYVQNVLTTAHKSITPDDLDYLLNKLPTDMHSVVNELDKLTNLNTKLLTPQVLNDNLSHYLENDVFALSESFINNEIATFLTRYKDYLLTNDDLIGLIALLNTNLAFVRDVCILRQQGHDANTITHILKVHPYRVKLAMRNQIGIADLNAKIKLIYRLQQGLINQTIDQTHIAEYLLIRNMSNLT